jgi:hypothetical protein
MFATLHDLSSKAALDSYLTSTSSILAGASAEAPQKYYALDVTDNHGRKITVGLVSSHHGIRPSWIFSADGNVLALGHDLTVTFIDVLNRRLRATQELEGVFFEFIDQSDHSYLIVLHERGVAKFDFLGRKLWSILTPDIAESAKMWNEDTLIVRHQGPGDHLAVDILTGRLISLR